MIIGLSVTKTKKSHYRWKHCLVLNASYTYRAPRILFRRRKVPRRSQRPGRRLRPRRPWPDTAATPPRPSIAPALLQVWCKTNLVAFRMHFKMPQHIQSILYPSLSAEFHSTCMSFPCVYVRTTRICNLSASLTWTLTNSIQGRVPCMHADPFTCRGLRVSE